MVLHVKNKKACNINKDYRTLRKRLFFMSSCFIVLLFALTVKLSMIQIIDHDKYTDIYIKQNQIVMEGVDHRGLIYDRNMNPLLGTEESFVYFIDKNLADSESRQALVNIKGYRLPTHNKKYDVYNSKVNSPEIASFLEENYDAFVCKVYKRYSEKQPAAHLIGYINAVDNKGAQGLERSFNDLLSEKTKSVFVTTDGKGKILRGLGVNKPEITIENGIVTTLDINIQKKAEEVMQAAGVNGSLVVVEPATGNILASVSTPVYDPSHIQKYLKSDQMEFINKSLQAEYPPGSIFKIIIVAAALESKKFNLDSKFYCNGYEEINGVRINCSHEAGHGFISLEDAFSKSCNSAFIQMGQAIGYDKLLEMSKGFGIGNKTLDCIEEERKGLLPGRKDIVGAGIGNFSIGQGRLLMTPIQASNMTNIILSDGIDVGLHLVSETIDNGVKQSWENQFSRRRVITSETATMIKNMMIKTVTDGTASNINREISAGGKTGSAQASDKGLETVHGWFTGFIPAENPEYIITVIVENGGSGSRSAVPIFHDMAKRLLD